MKNMTVYFCCVYFSFAMSQGFLMYIYYLKAGSFVQMSFHPYFPWFSDCILPDGTHGIEQKHLCFENYDDEQLSSSEIINLLMTCFTWQAIYLVPNACNPTGTNMGEERRRDIYAIAQEYNLIILEDDPYFFLQFSGEVSLFFRHDIQYHVNILLHTVTYTCVFHTFWIQKVTLKVFKHLED